LVFELAIMKDFQNKNIIITGGSSGIGFATAKEFARMGANLFLLARNIDNLNKAKQRLHQVFGPHLQIQVYSVDVSKKEEITSTITKIGNEFGMDVLINNAGIGGNVRFEEVTLERLEYTMNLNYWACVYSTKAAWKYLKEAKGHLGYVSSLAGYTGIYGFSNYSPTKFAITGFAEVIRMEAKDAGIGVTVLYPPDTDTPMMTDERRTPLPETEALSKGAKLMSPEEVAERFVKGIQHDRFEVLCNPQSHLVRVLKGTFPRIYFKILDSIIAKDRRRRGVIVT
jgi:3-dehydrosphinganine reductase